jgi:hypothetical protein
MNTSLSLFVSNPCLAFLSGACISFTSQPSVLLSSRLSLSYIIVDLHVPSNNHPTIIVLLYWLSLSSTPQVIRSVLSHVTVISHVTLCAPWASYPRECHLRSHRCLFWSRSLYPDGMSSLDIGTLGSYFRSRAFNEAVRPRGSRDEIPPKKSCEEPSDSTGPSAARTHGRKIYIGDREVFLYSIARKSSVLHGQCALHHFLVLPSPLVNIRMRFLLGGIYNTHVTKSLITIRILIKH